MTGKSCGGLTFCRDRTRLDAYPIDRSGAAATVPLEALECPGEAMKTITIGRRFCGPPNSGNGGYVCGMLARHIAGPAEVALRAPTPLDRPLDAVSKDDGVWQLRDGETVIATGRPASIELEHWSVRPSRRRWRPVSARPSRPTCTSCPRASCAALSANQAMGFDCSPGRRRGAARAISSCSPCLGFPIRRYDTRTELDKLDALLARTSTSAVDAALFAGLLSLPNVGRHPTFALTPRQRRRKMLEALNAQIEALARKKPVLMIFEDALDRSEQS